MGSCHDPVQKSTKLLSITSPGYINKDTKNMTSMIYQSSGMSFICFDELYTYSHIRQQKPSLLSKLT